MPSRGGFFGKIVDFLNRFSGKGKGSTGRASRFGSFAAGIDSKNEGMHRAIRLCDEALDAVSDRIILMNRLRDVQARMNEAEGYNRLTEDDAVDLKELLDRYASLARESRQLQYQTTSFDPGVTDMERHEDAAPRAIGEIKIAEGRQRIYRQDMGYLEGERMVLEDDRERLTNALEFVEKFSIGMVLFFGALTIFLVLLHAMQGMQTFYLLAATTLIVLIVGWLLYTLRVRLRNELALNNRKQHRAVNMLDTKTANYAHFTNFLNYEYKKFKVRSSQMLESNLEEYTSYKQLIRRLDSVRSIMHQTGIAIEMFLKDRNIHIPFASVEKFAQTANIDDQKHIYREAAREKGVLERSLSALEQRHTELWAELMHIKDQSGGADMDYLINEYMIKAGKMMVYDDTNDGKEILMEEEKNDS